MQTFSFKKKALLGCSLGIILTTQVNKSMQFLEPQKDEKRMNILFIMSDQHRGDFLGASGNQWISTPNLDKIAREGANFIKAYSSTPTCTPARTAILTGLSPWNHGMLGYLKDASQNYDCEMPVVFSRNGYITHAVGKNHFGPLNKHGYLSVELEEAWYSNRPGGFKCDYQKWFEQVAPGYDLNATGLGYNDHRGGIPFPFPDSLHATYWTAERAIRFLEKHKNSDSPWFLKVSFQRPHPPFDPPKRWMEYYENTSIPLPKAGNWAIEKYKGKTGSLITSPDASSGIYPPGEIRESLIAYAGGLSFVDEQIGRVIQMLIETGQYENTIILYTSDHGDMMGDQHMWRKGRPYEPSVRIPFIIRWPESMKVNARRGQIRSELIELRDIFPTFTDAANIEISSPIDGESIFKLFKKHNRWRKIIDLEHARIYEPDNAWVALTDGKYKYIYFTLTGEEQLFNLLEDPNELINIASDPLNRRKREWWYRKMVSHLIVRGDDWVRYNTLQIQKSSILKGKNFPENTSSSN